MEQYVKGFQRFYFGEDVRPVTPALARFYHLLQVYYKVRQVLLQSATAFFITKCDGLLLQSATAFLLQSVTILLQSATVITKCDDYYKVRQYTPSGISVILHMIRKPNSIIALLFIQNNS